MSTASPTQQLIPGVLLPVSALKSTTGAATGKVSATGDLNPLDCAWISLPQPAGWQKRAADKTPEEQLELSRRGLALSAGQRMTRDQKLDFSLRVIDRALKETSAWAVSFSGGRDSTVLSYLLVETMGLKIPHVFSNTRMEQPETLRQVATWRSWLAERGVALHTVYPEKRPGEVWEEGLPLFDKGIASKARQYLATGNPNHLLQVPEAYRPAIEDLARHGLAASEKCCDRLKKEPLHAWDASQGILGHLVGLRAEESQDRRMGYLQRGALYHSTRHHQWLATPLIHWTRDDIDGFLAAKGIAIEMSGRTGCTTCMFGSHLAAANGTENSLQKLHRENPKLWNQALDAWGYRKALDVLHLAYRRQVAVPEQETLWSETGIGPRQPAAPAHRRQDGVGTRRILQMGARRFEEHLRRLIDRGEAVDRLDQWQTVAEIARAWHIPSQRVSAFLRQGVEAGTWRAQVDFETAADGFGRIPLFRPVSVMDQAMALEDRAVEADREQTPRRGRPPGSTQAVPATPGQECMPLTGQAWE